MTNKFLRLCIILLQILAIAVEIGICIYGIVIVEQPSESYPYIAAVVRVVVILLVTIAYYKTSVSKTNPGNLFIISCLFFLSMAELSILSYFTTLSGWSFIPPRALVRTVMSSQFMVHFSLIGYAMQYQTNEHSSVVRLLLLGLAAVVFLTVFLPAAQEVSKLWNKKAPLVMLSTLAMTATVSHLILTFTESTKISSLRHMATVLMIAGNYITAVFDGLIIFTIIGSALFFLGGIITMIITLRNSVIL